jgi:hypothetical protein
MSLKQPNKIRVNRSEIQSGEWDYDGNPLAMHGGNLFTGYVVLDRSTNGLIESEIEYKNGSHVGWENEYNNNGQLIYTRLTVGETGLAFYEYDSNGNQIAGGKLTDDEYYQKMVTQYHLD